jgi:hypothetical protein
MASRASRRGSGSCRGSGQSPPTTRMVENDQGRPWVQNLGVSRAACLPVIGGRVGAVVRVGEREVVPEGERCPERRRAPPPLVGLQGQGGEGDDRVYKDYGKIASGLFLSSFPST